MSVIPQLIVNSLISGSMYFLVAAGLSLTYGVLRILNFAHGHIMILGGYLYFTFSILLGLSLYWSILGALIVSIIISLIIFSLFVKPFYRLNLFLPLVSTLALSFIIEAAISLYFGVNITSLNSAAFSGVLEWNGAYISYLQIIIIFSAVFIMIGLGLLLHFTRIGRTLRALTESQQYVETLGISTDRISLGVFILSGIIATYAGILAGMELNISPTAGSISTIKGFAAMIAGGLGNLWGGALGSFLLGFIENFSIGLDFGGYSLPSGYRDAF